MKPHMNLTSEDAGTTSRCHNMLMRPPNTYVLRSSTDMGSMGTHWGTAMAKDAHRGLCRLLHMVTASMAASARSARHRHTHGGH